jgi:hypothetical protein
LQQQVPEQLEIETKKRLGKLASLGLKVSLDGEGRWRVPVFIERLWRTLKDEAGNRPAAQEKNIWTRQVGFFKKLAQ